MSKNDETPWPSPAADHYVLVWHSAAGPTVYGVYATREAASEGYDRAIEDPANASCWVELAHRSVRRYRFGDAPARKGRRA